MVKIAFFAHFAGSKNNSIKVTGMIKAYLTNEILKYITEIEKNRFRVSSVKLSRSVANRLRKNSKKKSSYASNKIEGNPLSEKQAEEVIERDERKHFLKPEQEVRNYFLALNFPLEYCDIPKLLDELVEYVKSLFCNFY